MGASKGEREKQRHCIHAEAASVPGQANAWPLLVTAGHPRSAPYFALCSYPSMLMRCADARQLHFGHLRSPSARTADPQMHFIAMTPLWDAAAGALAPMSGVRPRIARSRGRMSSLRQDLRGFGIIYTVPPNRGVWGAWPRGGGPRIYQPLRQLLESLFS